MGPCGIVTFGELMWRIWILLMTLIGPKNEVCLCREWDVQSIPCWICKIFIRRKGPSMIPQQYHEIIPQQDPFRHITVRKLLPLGRFQLEVNSLPIMGMDGYPTFPMWLSLWTSIWIKPTSLYSIMKNGLAKLRKHLETRIIYHLKCCKSCGQWLGVYIHRETFQCCHPKWIGVEFLNCQQKKRRKKIQTLEEKSCQVRLETIGDPNSFDPLNGYNNTASAKITSNLASPPFPMRDEGLLPVVPCQWERLWGMRP
mmetsp:Transcript_8245/g.19890  ORF Transcript_8245/g.19890 Transcript_8245/m.19890 type:complete len:255 (-) Transcript_8245:1256-2020(-)